MSIYLLVLLRLIHVFGGALWIGAAIVYLFFVKPSVHAIGRAGPQFMRTMTERRRYPLFMVSASLLTVLSGAILYVVAWGGLRLSLLSTGPGMGFTIGALAALVAFVVGTFGIGPIAGRMGALGQEMGAAGGPPTAAQLSAMQTLEGKMARLERIDFVMLTISMATMATARYWIF